MPDPTERDDSSEPGPALAEDPRTGSTPPDPAEDASGPPPDGADPMAGEAPSG